MMAMNEQLQNQDAHDGKQADAPAPKPDKPELPPHPTMAESLAYLRAHGVKINTKAGKARPVMIVGTSAPPQPEAAPAQVESKVEVPRQSTPGEPPQRLTMKERLAIMRADGVKITTDTGEARSMAIIGAASPPAPAPASASPPPPPSAPPAPPKRTAEQQSAIDLVARSKGREWAERHADLIIWQYESF
jgi:hypothetical protein